MIEASLQSTIHLPSFFFIHTSSPLLSILELSSITLARRRMTQNTRLVLFRRESKFVPTAQNLFFCFLLPMADPAVDSENEVWLERLLIIIPIFIAVIILLPTCCAVRKDKID